MVYLLTALALILTITCFFVKRQILMAVSASLLWFGLAMYIFFSPTPILPLASTASNIFVWVFFILTFVPLLTLMDAEDTDIEYTQDGMKWKEKGPRPKKKTSSAYDKYFNDIKRRMR